MSLFIAFEGGDGTGKTTQARLLCDRLDVAGYDVLPVHEPGTTPLGLKAREWLKEEHETDDWIHANTELLLFLTARADLVNKILTPFLEMESEIVVADRYAASTLAYQGYGRGFSLDLVEAFNDFATGGLKPDLTLLLDCPPETALARVEEQNKSPKLGGQPGQDRGGTRFEKESLDFHRRVREGYLELADQADEPWVVFDANTPQDRLADRIWSHVQTHLSRSGCDSRP